jgi:hypothetical protein
VDIYIPEAAAGRPTLGGSAERDDFPDTDARTDALRGISTADTLCFEHTPWCEDLFRIGDRLGKILTVKSAPYF